MGKTAISWATHTVNWLAGCAHVSPACKHCYAETLSAQMAKSSTSPERYRDGVVNPTTGFWTGKVVYDPDALSRVFDGLYNAKKPRRVFVNSMSDTFHKDAPVESLEDLACAIREVDTLVRAGRPWPHVVMLLTKRPDRLLAWQREAFPSGLPRWVWVGCTVEDQRRANERVPLLCAVRTEGIRYVSCEPLLGPVELERIDLTDDGTPTGHPGSFNALSGVWWPAVGDFEVEARERGYKGHISWVIVGGESGEGARPMDPTWALGLRDESKGSGTAFHFKQWGAYKPNAEGQMVLARKQENGHELDGQVWQEFPWPTFWPWPDAQGEAK